MAGCRARSDRWFSARLFHGPGNRHRAPRLGNHRADHAGRFDLRVPRHPLLAGWVAKGQLPADEHSAARPAERTVGHGRWSGHRRPDWFFRPRPSLWLRAFVRAGSAPRGAGRLSWADAARRAERAVLWRRKERGGCPSLARRAAGYVGHHLRTHPRHREDRLRRTASCTPVLTTALLA